MVAPLIIHPFVPKWFPTLQIDWAVYVGLVLILLTVLALPGIERLGARDFEIEPHPPTPTEPFLSPSMMEIRVRELKPYPEQ